MCGRYYLLDDIDVEELTRIIEAVNRKSPAAKTRGEIFPGDVVPVLAGTRVLPMQWGMAVGNLNRPVINARSETCAVKPLFREAFLRRRCLVPASGYYEWEKAEGRKIKHAIHAGGLLYLAGLYRERPGQAPDFVILTREAAPGLSHIHDRMPVVLAGENRRAWLGGAQGETVLARASIDLQEEAL